MKKIAVIFILFLLLLVFGKTENMQAHHHAPNQTAYHRTIHHTHTHTCGHHGHGHRSGHVHTAECCSFLKFLQETKGVDWPVETAEETYALNLADKIPADIFSKGPEKPPKA